jgi:hypothetical protein
VCADAQGPISVKGDGTSTLHFLGSIRSRRSPFVLTSINCDGSKVVNTFAMSDSDFRFVRCEQHIADLTLRIAELKDPSSAAGSGLIHSTEFLALLQQTLESWQQHERSLTT